MQNYEKRVILTLAVFKLFKHFIPTKLKEIVRLSSEEK